MELFAAKKLIDGKFAEIQGKLERKEETSGFLAYLLSTNMSKEEVYGNISDIMLGAVDTVSNFVIENLKKGCPGTHPNFQHVPVQ